ncbi:TetR/AcrR family transcriptional regulator [Nocardia altamirensis]|uniref:TetR/AcrR family transcriptional regulator n=1 Tax=Nocardia altamirensis TaxID=472158 RepID=UPI0008400D80|nr:TetR/AcrR family transcriptional regulator [Nocardia altamirensis]
MTGSTDRRVRRTKSLLHRALIELMLERGYDRISVRDILHRADVGRSTFYAHFRDKDDLLLLSSTDYLRAAVTATGSGDTDATVPLAPVHTLFQMAAANPEVYQALLGRKSGALLLRTTREMVADILTEHLSELLDMDEAEFAATMTFLSWGIVGVLGAIADADPPIAPAEAYQRLEQLIEPGLSSRVRTG